MNHTTATLLVLCLLGGCAQTVTQRSDTPQEADDDYEVVFTIDLTEPSQAARASIRTGRGSRRLREMSFDFDPQRFGDFEGDGTIDVDGSRLVWNPPSNGGELRYRVAISHQRRNGGYDARVTDEWALFRGGDVFPPAATRVLKGSVSASRLELRLPDGWSAVTPYPSAERDFVFAVTNRTRGFDRPTGWLLVGEIGVRRARIANTRVAIAAPVGEDFRRMDVMAFLNWTLPGVVERFPTMDPRLVIIGAGDPMWRGGLSGPGSLYVHAERPLISENGTSTFLHELVHVAMGAAGPEHDDWLLEGLAEYYSIKILRTSGTLTPRRMELSLEDLGKWGEDVDDLFVRQSTGARTARATTLLAALDRRLEDNSRARRSLDDVVARMIADDRPWDYAALCAATRAVAGRAVDLLHPNNVPGAPDTAECR